jgi:hypothetical protein
MGDFRVGDWVRHINESKPFIVNEDNIKDVNDIPSNQEPWKPKAGEWCWFGFELVQVLDVQDNHVKICRQKSPTYEEIPQECLKPFIDDGISWFIEPVKCGNTLECLK